jgi:sugar/nucleoside kinase (ribokinase family)
VKYDILCLGDVNVDLILAGVTELPRFGEEVLAADMGLHLGGCTANVAVFCAALGLRTALRARVGRDEFGDFLLDALGAAGVCTDYILRDADLRTGITVSLSGPRDRAFVTYLGTIDSLVAADVADDLLASARHAHVGSYFMQRCLQPDLPTLLARAQALGLTTSLDTGFDPYGEWDNGLPEALRHVDVFMPNEVEAPRIARLEDPRQAAASLAATGGRVALKLGAAGSALYGGSGSWFVPGFAVDVVDTTCCGDAFDAGFLTAMLAGADPETCLRWGNAAGALIAGGFGACAGRLPPEVVARMAGALPS